MTSPTVTTDFPDPATSCVVVVDVQPEFWGPDIRKDFEEFPGNVAAVLKGARGAGIPVVWVRANYEEDRSPWMGQFKRMTGRDCTIPFNAKTSPWLDFAEPRAGEVLLRKHTFDGNQGTSMYAPEDDTWRPHTLEEHFAARGCKTAYVLGLVTCACVQHTAHGLFARGFRVVLVHDACADRGRERHLAALSLYRGYVYETVDAADFAEGVGKRTSA